MNSVERANHNGPCGKFVASRYDAVHFRSATWLERRVVQTLGLFDDFVKEGEAVREFRSPFSILVDAGINELLHEAVLIAFVDAQAVYQPRQEG